MVINVEPISPAKMVYSIANMPAIFCQPCFSGSRPVVIRLDENEANENAGNDGAEGELQISVITLSKPFARRSKKRPGARFGSDEGGEDGPPRDLPAAQREILQVALLPAHAQPDGDD